MKKALLTSMLALATSWLLACDICNIYLGINPNDYQHSVGFYYRSRMLKGQFQESTFAPKHFGHTATTTYYNRDIKELYDVYELRGRFYASPKLNIIASLPYINSYRSVDEVTEYDIYGFGDPMLIGNYQIYNTKCDHDSIQFVHRISVGTGVKFPIGATNKTYINRLADHDLQPGTGSLDFLLLAEYLFKYKSFGFNTISTYKINGANALSYRYGNGLNVTTNFFGLLNFKKATLMPSIGGTLESAGNDRNNDLKIKNSGGAIIFGQAGLSTYIANKFMIQATYQLALSNQLNNNQIPTVDRYVVAFNYLLN